MTDGAGKRVRQSAKDSQPVKASVLSEETFGSVLARTPLCSASMVQGASLVSASLAAGASLAGASLAGATLASSGAAVHTLSPYGLGLQPNSGTYTFQSMLDSLHDTAHGTLKIGHWLAANGSFEKDLLEKKKELEAATKKYDEAVAAKAATEKEKQKLQKMLEEMIEIEKLSFYRGRIHPDAFSFLQKSERKDDFFSGAHQTTVISVDIRKSTRLMLMAKNPKDFAKFTSELALGMREIIMQSHGVFDKFTGDGILAYFPGFFSGPDHVSKAITAAMKIHQMFDLFYKRNKSIFKTRPTDLGLGIGIDSGLIHLEQVGDEVYIIGDPVVYACRFGSAPAGKTWANPRIEDNLSGIGMNDIKYVIGEADVKGEGKVEILEIHGFTKDVELTAPEWLCTAAK